MYVLLVILCYLKFRTDQSGSRMESEVINIDDDDNSEANHGQESPITLPPTESVSPNTPGSSSSAFGERQASTVSIATGSYNAMYDESSTSANTGRSDESSTMLPLDTLFSLFSEKFSSKQIKIIYQLSDNHFEDSVECLLSGASLEAIVQMLNKCYARCPVIKIHIDSDEIWSDLSFYKCVSCVHMKRLRVCLDNAPPVDTGGVRRQVFTTTFSEFVQNTRIRLFDGPAGYIRPYYSAESRGSGIFKALGMMVGHSICQDGIGFPFFSPLCYWYIASGEEKALEYSCLDDIGQDSTAVISKVCVDM